ncbi:MAG: quinone oxidoreductase [Burkholderiales bacterium]|nr:MAG: quinone oxidoreductase [Burkholderiales bacterium]
MQVARIHAQGGPEQIRIETVPVPVPGPGQVLIRVESASVNFSDVKRRRGDAYPFESVPPFVPGGEVAGTVAALGAGVAGPAVGSPVFALVGGNGQGGYAQFALAYAPQVTPLPPGLDADRASVLIVAGATAALMLRQVARLQAGQSILVPAAAGAVGSYVVQLARHLGAGLVVAGVSSAAKGEAARELGAHVSVDYTRPGWADEVLRATDGRGVDVLLEASGGDVLAQGLRTLAPFGQAIVYGAASGEAATLDPATLERFFYAPAPNQSLVAFNVGGWFLQRPQQAGAALGELIGLIAQGSVKTPAILTMPLAAAAEAHRLLESRQTSGKLVLKPW